MANENEAPKGDEVESLEDIVESQDEFGNDTTDWKSIALKSHAIAKKNGEIAEKRSGMAKRFKTKLEKHNLSEDSDSDDDKDPKGQKGKDNPEKKELLDRVDRAVLRVEKITDPEEVALVENYIKETGKTVDQILESKIFQSELQEMRDLKKSDDAVPSGTKRSGNSSSNTVEYWLKKGGLPPADQVELRRKVVAARMKSEEASKFSPNPIV
jgi:hypothetical protein